MSKLSLVTEIWAFLKERKAWWLTPIVAVIVLLGLLLVFAQAAGPLAPFIYTIF